MKLAQNIVLGITQGERISEGFVTLVIGMSVVFIALLILVVILETSGKFFDNLGKNTAAKQASAPAPVISQVDDQIDDQIDDLELIAVITATIAASMGTDSDNLQVRSLRKTNNVWRTAGRKEQLYN